MTHPAPSRILLPALIVFSAATYGVADPLIPAQVEFNRDIRPILSDACFRCHGPDTLARKAGLRLDLRPNALKPANSGETPIVPGKPEESELVRRILSDDEDDRMPPPKAHRSLTATQKKLVERWILQGADYQPHWCYMPIRRPPVPKPSAHPVDAFIRERLRSEGLKPAADADRGTLIRRVSLDLTGLPPTPAEVDGFVNDTAPDAYERVVDRLLASPHFGERMAVDWLDAARYADSNGYQVDRDRMTYAWRDWVIRAFNDNQGFDQFTIEQIAGDLLPGATREQRIATGFHRNHMLNEEGGILPDEFLAEYTADRVETTATVWLGQTFNCTRCHDHKFDPFTQRDFYGMKAFFHNVSENGVGQYGQPPHLSSPPFLKLPSVEMEQKLAGLNAEIQQVKVAQTKLTEESRKNVERWAQELATKPVTWSVAEPQKVTADFTEAASIPERQAVRFGRLGTRENKATLTVMTPLPRITALRVRCSSEERPTTLKWSELSLVLVTTDGKKEPLKLNPVEVGKSLSADGGRKLLDNNRSTSTGVSVNEKNAFEAVFELEQPLTAPGEEGSVLEVFIGSEAASESTLWQVEATADATDRLVPEGVEQQARKEPAKWSTEERQKLTQILESKQPAYRELSVRLTRLTKALSEIDTAIPTTLVMDEMPKPRETFILMRGVYDKPGEKVTASTPAALPAMRDDLPRNRLGLARWLIDPANPLPARVTVNRLWQMLFGTGLVRTAEDFGAQGEAPSHPELLDWLASEFIASGWDVKAMLRLLVTSATYRQSSKLTPTLHERDPENRLLARGPRFRLQGEFVRDQALAVSGLLVAKVGGPSVKPYHPPGLYEQITAGNGTNVYVEGKDDDLHRRSLYTYWKRSVPHPAMLIFDAPFRETCTLRRPRTNTPLQALNLLNDPTYVEAARFLAQRMLLEGGDTIESRLTFGFRLALARTPRSEEMAILKTAWERTLKDYQADAASAATLLKVGQATADSKVDAVQLAALTTVASTLLNLDETVTKE